MKKIIGVVCGLLSCLTVAIAEEPSSSVPPEAQEFEGVNLVGYSEGNTKAWDVKGKTANVEGNTINLQDIVANTYGQQKVNLVAQNGTMDQEKGSMHLEKDVVVTTEDGATLITDSLDWDKQKDLVTTEDQVYITKDAMTASGTGAQAQPTLNKAQINQDVTVHVDTKTADSPGQKIMITCDGPLEVDYSKQMAVFKDHVVATETTRKLTADRMEVTFDAKTNQIKQMVCIGNVSIAQGENVTHSDRAVYKADEQRLVLSGSPKIVFYSQTQEQDVPTGN